MTHFKTLARIHRQQARNKYPLPNKVAHYSFQDGTLRVAFESVRLAGRSSKVINRLLELDYWCKSGFHSSVYEKKRKFKGVTIIEENKR